MPHEHRATLEFLQLKMAKRPSPTHREMKLNGDDKLSERRRQRRLLLRG